MGTQSIVDPRALFRKTMKTALQIIKTCGSIGSIKLDLLLVYFGISGPNLADTHR